MQLSIADEIVHTIGALHQLSRVIARQDPDLSKLQLPAFVIQGPATLDGDISAGAIGCGARGSMHACTSGFGKRAAIIAVIESFDFSPAAINVTAARRDGSHGWQAGGSDVSGRLANPRSPAFRKHRARSTQWQRRPELALVEQIQAAVRDPWRGDYTLRVR